MVQIKLDAGTRIGVCTNSAEGEVEEGVGVESPIFSYGNSPQKRRRHVVAG